MDHETPKGHPKNEETVLRHQGHRLHKTQVVVKPHVNDDRTTSPDIHTAVHSGILTQNSDHKTPGTPKAGDALGERRHPRTPRVTGHNTAQTSHRLTRLSIHTVFSTCISCLMYTVCGQSPDSQSTNVYAETCMD